LVTVGNSMGLFVGDTVGDPLLISIEARAAAVSISLAHKIREILLIETRHGFAPASLSMLII